MPSSVVKEGLLTESNCAITEEQLNAIIRRGQQITDFYEQEKDCFARGKFAQVRRICHKETGINYAAKSIKRRRPRCGDVTNEILHEIRVLLTSDQCNRVVDVHEVFETPNEYILVLELAKGGELQQILDEDERIEEKICRNLLRQIVEGVRFLHSHNIAHLDLKPQNILLTNPLPDGNVKLCDFGISRYISESTEIREIMGTTDYMAPEILQYDPISLASDIWCIGIVAYVLLSGHSPFGGNDKQETYSNITSGALEFPESLFENVSEQAKDFIRRCLVRDPCERMTCDECLEHEWISNEALKLDIVSTCNEVLILSNNSATCDEDNNKEVKLDLSFTEKCNSSISVSALDKVEDLLEPEQPLLLTANAQQNDVNQNFCCDTQSGHVNTLNNVEMDTSNQPLSYESDKENEEIVDTLIQSSMVNVQDFEKIKQQLTDLTGNTSFNNLNSFYKSHKRLSSDIFPSSDHQKLIAVVASNSSSNLGALKKYTSESAMSTVNAANGSPPGEQQESTQRVTRFSSNRNDSNNNLRKDHSPPIQVPIVVEASNGTVSVSNGETSPPSTPNKKIYLSIDDSFCHFGSSSSETSKLMFTKLLPSSISTSPNATTVTVLHNSPTGVCSKIRSVSVERLNTCTRVETSNASTKAISCFDAKMDQVFSAEPYQNYQFSSSTTISSSSTSSSLSSLVSTINFTRVHQQMSSQVSSPGC